MSKLLFPLLCLSLAIWLFGGSYWFAKEYAQPNIDQGWTVIDGRQSFRSETIFSFQKADAEIILDDNQLAVIAQIGEYMHTNPDRALILTGDYTTKERKDSGLENLGRERAQSFRYLIYRQGIDLERIILKERQVKSHAINENGLINGGVSFDFIESPFKKYGEAFSFEKVIHFDHQGQIIRDKNSYELYLAALRQYMVDYPSKNLTLNAGYLKNDKPSLQTRIDNLIADLRNQGIDEDRIKQKNTEEISDSSAVELIEIIITN